MWGAAPVLSVLAFASAASLTAMSQVTCAAEQELDEGIPWGVFAVEEAKGGRLERINLRRGGQ